MSLRLITAVLPLPACTAIRSALGEAEVLSLWVQPLNESEDGGDSPALGLAMVSLLVRTEHTEAILDQMQGRFGSNAGFRMLLLPVEATIPRIDEPEPPADEPRVEEKPEKPVPARISREELYHDLTDGIRINGVFLVLVVLSAIVAAVGLIRDNVAVLIGAMVIAPLLTPNAALALAATLGDLNLARRALFTNIIGSGSAFALSVAMGALVDFDPGGPELANRTVLGIGDIILALSAGVAGALAYTSGVASGLIGVMVAVALMPPLVAAGLLLGAGEIWLARDAALLLAANVICVNLAGVGTFVAQGIRPRTWWEADRARQASIIAASIWLGLLGLLLLVLLSGEKMR